MDSLSKSTSKDFGNSLHGSEETNLTSIHEDKGLIPGLAQWVKVVELWCRSQMQHRSCVAVAVT